MHRNILVFASLFVFACSVSGYAAGCFPNSEITSVQYLGKVQGDDHIQVNWNVTAGAPCSSTISFLVTVNITRKNGHQDSGQVTVGPTIRAATIKIARGVLETDPVSYVTTIVTKSIAKASGGLKATGTGDPKLFGAQVGPIGPNPIGRFKPFDTLLRAVYRPAAGAPHLAAASVQATQFDQQPCEIKLTFGNIRYERPAGDKDKLIVAWGAQPAACASGFQSFKLFTQIARQGVDSGAPTAELSAPGTAREATLLLAATRPPQTIESWFVTLKVSAEQVAALQTQKSGNF